MNRPSAVPIFISIALCVVLGGVVFHAPLTIWLGTFLPSSYELILKSWKELILALMFSVLTVQVIRRGIYRDVAKDWFFRIAGIYAVIHILTLLWSWHGITPTFAGLLIDLRFVLAAVVVYGFVKLYPGLRQLLVKTLLVAGAASLLFAVLQVTVLPRNILEYIGYHKGTTIAPYMTVDQNYDFVRINGTLRGPNPLGAFAIIMLTVALSILVVGYKKLTKQKRLILGLIGLFALIALWYSYSRSALFAGVAAIAFIFGYSGMRWAPRQTIGIVTGVVLTGIITLVLTWHTSFVQNVIVHENPAGGGEISSNDQHAESLRTGWHRLLTQPLGAGVGSTGSASLYGTQPLIIENQYLFVAHEVGWLGLIAFLALLGLVIRRLWQRRNSDSLALGLLASGVALSLIGILLPVWVDDTVSIVWWSLTAAVIASPLARTKK